MAREYAQVPIIDYYVIRNNLSTNFWYSGRGGVKEGRDMVDESEQSALTEGVYLILLSMLRPRHGYSVMQYIGKLTKGRVVLGAGTLYGAINTLADKEWIRSVAENKNSRKKEYVITDLGMAMLKDDMARMEELLFIAKAELENAQS